MVNPGVPRPVAELDTGYTSMYLIYEGRSRQSASLVGYVSADKLPIVRSKINAYNNAQDKKCSDETPKKYFYEEVYNINLK